MYKIIIADDEEAVRYGICKLIEKVFPEKLYIVAACCNGSDVIKEINNDYPDILVIDINMPKASGMDVAKYISEKKLNIHTIMITGYAKFEYAKDALNYHVENFLTKPFESSDLISCINTIIEKLDNNNSTYELPINYQQNYTKNKDLISLGYSGILTHENVEKHRLFYTDTNLSDLSVCSLKFFSNNPIEIDKDKLSDIGEFSSDMFESYLVEKTKSSFIFVIIMKKPNQNTINQFINDIISGCLLLYYCNVKCHAYEFVSFDEWLSECFTEKIVSTYFDNIHNSNYTFAIDQLNISLKSVKPSDKKNLFISIVENFKEIYGMDIQESTLQSDYSEKSFTLLHNEIIKNIYKSYNVINEIKDYVDKNYASNTISLSNISKQLHMNETYLSRVFKEKTNKKFIDYLSSVRVENAKKLLASDKYTINNVATFVGYNQVKHFRSVFKKYTGVTASEYIKKSKIEDKEI